MSLLVHYTLKSADDHGALASAMEVLVADLKVEAIPGLAYQCFATDEATKFLGVLQFDDDAGFKTFQSSAAFATYRETVKPILAGPPSTEKLAQIADTRA